MYLGEDIKKLGFGLMRLPKKDDKIDLEEVKLMVDKFIAAGFTYFDTAWAYEGSEDAIRQALVERYPREKFQLATKLAAWIGAKTKEDAQAQFETSLKRTGAGYFDFYLLHNLGEMRTESFDRFGIWDFVKKKKEEGLVKHIGFSFHSSPEELETVLKAHPEAEFVQLQLNYADWDSHAIHSRANYEIARKYGKPVVVMEPVKGGLLANPPKKVSEIFKEAEPESSVASWGIRFAADLEGVITVLSGMSSLEQMEDNISTMEHFKGLTESEKETLKKAQEAMASYPIIPCTTCNYCAKACPQNIGISGTFEAMNLYTLYGDLNAAKGRESWMVASHGKQSAKECIKCGACEEACPQQIQIRDELEKAVAALKL